MLKPDEYEDLDLIDRYKLVCAELASLYHQHCITVVAERKARHSAFWSDTNPENSITGKDRWADYQTLTNWIASKELEADIKDYEVEKQMLENLLWH